MKNKAKQTFSFILMLTFILTALAGCEGANNTQNSTKPVQTDLSKWVLTREETLFNFSNNNWIEQSAYGYDQYGRLNYYHQLHTYDTSVQEYTYSDFSYDENGNVLSYTEMKSYENETEKRLCQFEYDKNSKLIKSITTHSNTYEEFIEFEYDANGNIIKKKSKELFDGEFNGESIDCEYTLTYNNNLCIMAEIVAVINEYEDGAIQYTETEYVVEKYFYDSNGNKVKSENYWGNSDNDYGDVMINGRYYGLETTTTYTWQKLGDIISGTPDNNVTQPNDNNIIEENNNYNGLPVPIKLNLIGSNEKTSLMNSSEYTLDIDGLYLIKDIDGYDYLALTYTITTLADYKIKLKYFTDIATPTLTQNGKWLERYFDLSYECKSVYGDIISSESLLTELRPGQTITTTTIYEIYDTTTDIYVEIMPDYADGSDSGLVRIYSFD